MDNIVLVHESNAFDDGGKSGDDFFFIEMDDVETSFSIFELDFEGGLFLGVEESIIVLDGFEKSLVHNIGLMLSIGIGLKILIGLFGRFMK